MPYSASYREFRKRFSEISIIIRAGERQSTYIRQGITPQLEFETACARAATVFLVSHIEGYYNEVAREILSLVKNRWSDLSPAHCSFLSRGISELIVQKISEIREGNFTSGEDIRKLKYIIGRANAGLSNPVTLPDEVKETKLIGFHIDSAPKSVNKLLSSFDPLGEDFFKWLSDEGQDRGLYWTTLDNVTRLRNDIAHGNLYAQCTLHDAKAQSITCARLVRFSDKFLCRSYPDIIPA